MGFEEKTGLDSDIAAVLPTTATPYERLIAIQVDDARRFHDASLAKVDLAREMQADFNATIAAMVQVQKGVAEEMVSEPNLLLARCVLQCIDVRRQTTSTSTTDTTFRDIVRDGTRMGYWLYNYLAPDFGFPLKNVPTTVGGDGTPMV